jgi:membrane fusion protein (multidrug efflux system)
MMLAPRLAPLLLVLAACHGAPDAPAPVAAEAVEAAVSVRTVAAVSSPMPTRVPLVGTLVASKQAQVAADTSGVVVETRVERGERVRKGQVLVVIDSRTTGLSAAASAAQALATSAQADVAAKDCARAEDLYKQGVIARAQYERTRAACDAQGGVAEAARATAELASGNLERTKVKAPFAGIVGERMVEVGAFVQPPSPVATLYAAGPLRVRVSVPELQSGGVAEGRAVRVFPTALASESFAATVKFVGGAIREATRDLVVEAELDAADARLRPGMSVRVEMDVGEQPAVVVPVTALRRAEGTSRLFVAVEGRAQERVVRLGAEKDGSVAVLTDLVAGEKVVDAPPADLRDGATLAGE